MHKEEQIYELLRKAGKSILDIYHDKSLFANVEIKKDNSPLTLADQRSHEVINEGLLSLFPDIPIISEEGKDIDFSVRKNFNTFWLVDPLDGTKEFINRNGDFTVNIALIEDKYPVMGFIYVPVTEELFCAIEGKAWKFDKNGTKTILTVNNKSSNRVAVRSRSHASPEEEAILQKYSVTEEMSRGSSLKFCAVAEGKADVYYRHGPTMEWDTAAGQAILEAAGGKMYVGNSEEVRFNYNKESLLNPGFLCLGF